MRSPPQMRRDGSATAASGIARPECRAPLDREMSVDGVEQMLPKLAEGFASNLRDA
jgi:hypothetical protein